MTSKDSTRVSKWYFGGIAASCAANCTHPLDLLKVHLQTAYTGSAKQLRLIGNTVHIVRSQGVIALYNGLSAQLLRQMTYSTTRFGIYDVYKRKLSQTGEHIPFYQKVLLAGVSGAAGGYVGTPADMVNVRMQNDIKLSINERRNYKHAIDGLYRVYKHEGIKALFRGATTTTIRASVLTIGQLSMYDQCKYILLTNFANIFSDNLLTHFTASTLAGTAATTMTQPLDVLKVRLMNSKPNEYKSIAQCAQQIFKELGIFGFYKGYVPAFISVAPHTILTFIFFEQLRLRFGTIIVNK